ncbi:MAG: hypothetical protein GY861_04750 [bacterium]|nr:hypothetical protein [bacterium]
MFKPKYFAKTLESFTKQVVPPSMWERWGVQALDKMDQRILEFIDEFRKDCGVPLTANDWSWGGRFTQRGVRDVNQYGTYEKMEASRSDHITGRAIDLVSSKLSGNELRLVFIKHKDKYFEKYGINFIEVGQLSNGSAMSWFHAGININQGQGVQYWSPKHGFVSEEFVIENKL